MPSVDIYPNLNMTDMISRIQSSTRYRAYEPATKMAHKVWQDAVKQYMFDRQAVSAPLGEEMLPQVLRSRTLLMSDDTDQDKYQLYVSVAGDVERLMSGIGKYDWSREYVTDCREAFSLYVHVLARGSIVMRYYDVVRGEMVDGYGSDFVAMTEQIERRMVAETQYRARLFSGRRFVSHLFALGNITREVSPGYDLLFAAAKLNMPLLATRDAIISGELQTYLQPNVPSDFVRSIFIKDN